MRLDRAVTAIACSGRCKVVEMLKVFIFTLLISLGACQVVRPCALSDLACIGRNLAANSRCNPNVPGRIPARYTVQSLPFHAPYFNATYIDYNLVVSNHNRCRVSEFFINLSSKTAVLSLDCPNLDFESNRLTIQHASLQEDRQFSYRIQGTYPLIRLTTNLHASNGLNLCSSLTFADVVALPKFRLNPNNKQTANYLSRDLTLLNVFERECFFWRASLLARYFINSLICNYGCNL
ncbi:PREDICTED: fibrohexamerin-like [Papilio xuthus]|uniref:Fibrohexamerin-like n=1 Tax=Papilio xuthus TaxID=66420 RepID=A0AAJ6ZNE3_PAPXU